MRKQTFRVIVVVLVTILTAIAAHQSMSQNFDPETDVKSGQNTMIRTANDTYTVHVEGISMRKAVDILVDASLKARQVTQTFDQFTITWNGALYTITDEQDKSFFTATSFDEIKKEVKKQMKLILDNL